MHPGIFQWVEQLRNSIVKSLFAWPDCRGTAPTNYLTVTQT